MLIANRHAAAVVAALIAGAPATGGTALGAASTTEPEPVATGFAGLLASTPSTALADDSATLWYVDMDLVWERLGAGASAEQRTDVLGQLSAVESFSFIPQVFHNIADVEGARAEVGFTAFEIHRELAVLSPPSVLFIDETSVTADAVTTAVEANPDWSGDVTTVESDHGSYFSWGDGAEPDLERTSTFRELGLGGQFAAIGDDDVTTVRTVEESDMDAALAVIDGDGESAADTGPFAMLDEALTGDVLQVVGVPRPIVFDPPPGASPEVVEELLAESTFLNPYEGLVIAEIVEDGEFRTEIFVINADDGAAAANADVVTALIDGGGLDPVNAMPYAELFPNASVAADGVLTRVTIDGVGHFARPFRMIQTRALFPMR